MDETAAEERAVAGSTLIEPPQQQRRTRSRFERGSGVGAGGAAAAQRRGGGFVLTERDAELLTALFTHQLMDRGQIQALYFSSVPRCNARLRQLFDQGLVGRTFSPLSPYGSQGLYRISARAASIVAGRLDMDAAEVKRLCRTGEESPQFVEHTLAVVDFYLALRKAVAEHPDAVIETWLPELLCRHEYEVREPGAPAARSGAIPSAGRGWRAQVFKPDGFVRLWTPGGGYRSYFLEVDRGHTSSSRWAQKLTFHRRYAESGLFAETYGGASGDFTTLVITTGERRLAHLSEIAQQEGACRFWFTTFSQVEERGALAPIWHVPVHTPVNPATQQHGHLPVPKCVNPVSEQEPSPLVRALI